MAGFLLWVMACGPIVGEDAEAGSPWTASGAGEPTTTGATTTGTSIEPTTDAMPGSTGEDDSGSSGATSSGSAGSTGEEATSTGADASTTGDDITTGESSGGSGDATEGDSEGFAWLNKPAGLEGCSLAAIAGTDVQGSKKLGQFAGTRAFFGFTAWGLDVNQAQLRVWVMDEAADVELSLQEIATQYRVKAGPAAFIDFEGKLEDTQWLGTQPVYGHVIVDEVMTSLAGELEIVAHLGSWDVADPNDPPRVVGTVSGSLGGSFDAVYCDAISTVLKEG